MILKHLAFSLFLSGIFIYPFKSSAQTDWVLALEGRAGNSNPPDISLVTDQWDHVYTIGSFADSIDLDPSISDLIVFAEGEVDLFIQKSYSNGNLAWAHSFGSSGMIGVVLGRSITIDASDNLYVVGAFNGAVDFDPGPGTAYASSNGNLDAFILKLDSDGNFLWVKSFGGPTLDTSTGITLDDAGNIYTVGVFSGFDTTTTVDMNPNSGIANFTCAGNIDMFIQKLDGNGNFIWAKTIGAEGYDQANSITVDNANNPIITGYFESTVDFDPTNGVTELISNGHRDIHITKLDENGNLMWAKSVGASEWDNGLSIVHDDQNDVYVTGYFEQTVDFDPNSTLDIHSSWGDQDIFVLKLTENGNFDWAKSFGSTDEDAGNKIAIDNANNIYVTGHFSQSVNFALPTGNLTSAGNEDIFIQKMDASGTTLLVNSFGGPGSDNGSALTVTDGGKIYATGVFQETADFDATSGTLLLTEVEYIDVFILKVSLLENVGIEDLQKLPQITVAPNPNNGEFTLSTDDLTSEIIGIEIMNELGQSIWKSNEIKQKQTVNLKKEEAGVYFIKLIGEQGVSVQKFVVN